MDENNNTNVNEQNNEQENESEKKEGKFYTEEEIELMIQKAGDKRITQYQKTMEKKQREAEKLAKMNEDDKRIYELEQREQALLDKEIELQRLENKSEGLSILAEKGLSPELIDFVLADEAETMYDNIKTLDKAFKASVRAEVEKRLNSSNPKKSASEQSLTKKDIAKMSYSELIKLKQTDPDAFNALR